MAEEIPSRASSASDLETALRTIIRDELQRPAPAPKKMETPSKTDVLWLGVFLADCALISFWFPEGLKGPLEFVQKLLPWLLGGMFVVANDWFREQSLSISRRPMVRVVQLSFLIVGILAGVHVIPVTAAVNPEGTTLSIDTPSPVAYGQTIWVALRDHEIQLTPGTADPKVAPRKLKVHWWRILRAMVDAEENPDWRLIYPVAVDTPEARKVTIARKSGKFDEDFLEPANLQASKLKKINNSSVEYQSSGSVQSDKVNLPWGEYSIWMAGCRPETLEVVSIAKLEKGNINFKQLATCIPKP